MSRWTPADEYDLQASRADYRAITRIEGRLTRDEYATKKRLERHVTALENQKMRTKHSGRAAVKAPKRFVGEVGDYLYAVQINGVNSRFPQAPFGQQIDDLARVKAWKASPGVKSDWIFTKPRKGQKPGPQLRAWLAAVQPAEVYARWDLRVDDDTREVFYREGTATGARAQKARRAEKLYHVVVRNDRTGKDTRMTATPVPHATALVIKRKMIPDRERPAYTRTVLVPVGGERARKVKAVVARPAGRGRRAGVTGYTPKEVAEVYLRACRRSDAAAMQTWYREAVAKGLDRHWLDTAMATGGKHMRIEDALTPPIRSSRPAGRPARLSKASSKGMMGGVHRTVVHNGREVADIHYWPGDKGWGVYLVGPGRNLPRTYTTATGAARAAKRALGLIK